MVESSGHGTDHYFHRLGTREGWKLHSGVSLSLASCSDNVRDWVHPRGKPFHTQSHRVTYWWISQCKRNCCYPPRFSGAWVEMNSLGPKAQMTNSAAVFPPTGHTSHLKTPSFGPLGNQARVVNRPPWIHHCDHCEFSDHCEKNKSSTPLWSIPCRSKIERCAIFSF